MKYLINQFEGSRLCDEPHQGGIEGVRAQRAFYLHSSWTMSGSGASKRAEQRGRILLVYAAGHAHTRLIADAIASRLRNHGYLVEIGDAATGGMPPPEDYDAVVLGSSLEDGPYTRLITSYIHHNRGGLAEVPTSLFTVSTSGSARDTDPGGFLENLLRSARWRPDFAAAFAGGSRFPGRACSCGLPGAWATYGPAPPSQRSPWTGTTSSGSRMRWQ